MGFPFDRRLFWPAPYVERGMEKILQPAVEVDACECNQLEDGADGCPHYITWGKCELKRTA